MYMYMYTIELCILINNFRCNYRYTCRCTHVDVHIYMYHIGMMKWNQSADISEIKFSKCTCIILYCSLFHPIHVNMHVRTYTYIYKYMYIVHVVVSTNQTNKFDSTDIHVHSPCKLLLSLPVVHPFTYGRALSLMISLILILILLYDQYKSLRI